MIKNKAVFIGLDQKGNIQYDTDKTSLIFASKAAAKRSNKYHHNYPLIRATIVYETDRK